MRVSFKRNSPPPGVCTDYPGRASRVYVPVCRGDLAPMTETDHKRGKARDTVFIPHGAARLNIQLDDGRGLGFPMPACRFDTMALCLAYPGSDVWSAILPLGGVEPPSSIVVRLQGPGWERLDPGYLDGQIRFVYGALTMIGRPVGRGWLRFYKEEPPVIKALSATAEMPRHDCDHPGTLQHEIRTYDDV